ncbi:hypothetical protein H6F87_02980 [Cyanobacteria bacterium FACHB-502]|nr:hypothetical protein [Cyanobacteria bacterium FACHB-502]
MQQSSLVSTPAQRVVARLRSEGWVGCPGLGFPALWQHSDRTNLRSAVMQQLQQAGQWMWERDLQVAMLVFSIPAHEFQIHPHLKDVLNQLEVEGIIEIRASQLVNGQNCEMGRAVLLKAIDAA